MVSHHSSPISVAGSKRRRQSSFDGISPYNGDLSPKGQFAEVYGDTGRNTTTSSSSSSSSSNKAGQSSSFRNVSACNRCRLRKNRCDQRLPSCASCSKAGVACVGYDPITKKEIPRSYVYYLEARVEKLEKLLVSNNISYPPSENLEYCSRFGIDAFNSIPTPDSGYSGHSEVGDRGTTGPHALPLKAHQSSGNGHGPAVINLVSSPKARSLATASGVSFAKVVLSAFQCPEAERSTGASDRFRAGNANRSHGGTSMRDSFFGLQTKPTVQPAPFPDKEVGHRLVTLYFEHANPQIPILHRGEFMQMFDHAYAASGRGLSAREFYMLNMVFAIGCGVIVGEPVKAEACGDMSGQSQPEEYHASAIVHLDACLSCGDGGLEVLQAVLLLANFALLRPIPPGLWYITGVAVRLAVDLGLYHDDGEVEAQAAGSPTEAAMKANSKSMMNDGHERGRRLQSRDFRRRLWWCTYSFDRLVSTCVGRPFGVSDQVITTELPSLLDDEFITGAGLLDPPAGRTHTSYKHVAHHYFRLRLLQSEILQVLQYNGTQVARVKSRQSGGCGGVQADLACPFLARFDSFRSWRCDIDRRLYQWKTSAPTRKETGVAFSTEFLELNYWQAVILLYRQSLSVPVMFEGEYNTTDEVNSRIAFGTELREDGDKIYLRVAKAGQKVLRLYRQLHLSGLVSYTYLSTHHLFTAGIAYLYAIWHSSAVRSRLSMDEVDFTVLAAKSVFSDMMDKCPPAETCRDAFDRTAKATIKMASASGGFGASLRRPHRERRGRADWGSASLEMDWDEAWHRMDDEETEQGSSFQPDLVISDNISSSSLEVTDEEQATLLGDGPTMVQPSKSKGISAERMKGLGEGLSTTAVGRRTEAESPARWTLDGTVEVRCAMQGPVEGSHGQQAEFLESLGAASNGDEEGHLDLGFGLSWEGLHSDYGEGQQMNPFESFFFGGQPQGGRNDGEGTNREGIHGGEGQGESERRGED